MSPLVFLSLLSACVFGGESEGFGGTGIAGCAAPAIELGAVAAADLEDPSGCHYMLTAANEDETLRLLVDAQAFADAALEGSGAATYTLPDAAARVEVEVGCELNGAFCTDAVEFEPQVSGTYTATAGTLTVSALRDESSCTDEGGCDATATVSLEGVVLEDEGGNVLTLEALTWEDVRLYNPSLG